MRPRCIGIGWAMVAAIIWLSLTPTPPTLEVSHGDKLGHVGAYAALMFWFCQLYAGGVVRVAYAFGFALMGIALEFAQGATGFRTFEMADMAANAAGVALGWVVAALAPPLRFARAPTTPSKRD